MTSANRFSSLADVSPAKFIKTDSSTFEVEQESKNISQTSTKKTPIKIILGHRSYKDELSEKDAYYYQENDDQRTNAYNILADKEKLASSLIKSRMCSSVDKKEVCQNSNCGFAHSLDELKISNCLFEKRCRFVQMSNGELVNNGEKVCSHKHPQETDEKFMIRTGLDRYKRVPQSVAQAQVAQAQVAQAQVAQAQVPSPQQLFLQPPFPQQSFWQPQPPPFLQQSFWQPPPPTFPQQSFWQPPPPPFPQQSFWQPPPPPFPQPSVEQPTFPQPSIEQQCQTDKVDDTLATVDQILIIRVPKELANQALEIAMNSGKTRIQIDIIN